MEGFQIKHSIILVDEERINGCIVIEERTSKDCIHAENLWDFIVRCIQNPGSPDTEL